MLRLLAHCVKYTVVFAMHFSANDLLVLQVTQFLVQVQHCKTKNKSLIVSNIGNHGLSATPLY